MRRKVLYFSEYSEWGHDMDKTNAIEHHVIFSMAYVLIRFISVTSYDFAWLIFEF